MASNTLAEDPELLQAVSYGFSRGMDSKVDPRLLPEGFYSLGENVVCRGGIVQTRPGTRQVLNLPQGNPQGFHIFTPKDKQPEMLVAIDGLVYRSQYPYSEYTVLPDVTFSPSARYVVFQNCIQSTDYTVDGALFALEQSIPLVVMQDGLSRAAYYDGATSRHLNPEQSGTEETQPFFDETPIGLWMEWSGNRLWVARNNQVFASDYGNPLKFTEAQYLAEGRAFYFSDNITGLVEVNNPNSLLVFTERNTTQLLSNITTRTEWLNTPNFQQVILPSIGCVAPRSIMRAQNVIWWYSAAGLVNFDTAFATFRSSRIPTLDDPMMASKGGLSQDLRGMCGTVFENYLLLSAPSGDTLNRHTWAMDLAPGNDAPAWNSYWTGWLPVQWASATISGTDQCFFLSFDYDGCNRIWQAFQPDRTDNGGPIDCFFITRLETFQNIEYKKFGYIEAELGEILGDVSLMVARAGEVGSWKVLARRELVATPGSIGPATLFGSRPLVSNRTQSRFVVTEADDQRDTECNQDKIETKQPDSIQKSFQLLFLWSGRMGVKFYRIFARLEKRPPYGEAPDHERGPQSVSQFGCQSASEVVLTVPFEVFTESATVTGTTPADEPFSVTREAFSWISPENARRKAQVAAQLAAESFSGTSTLL
jgi:hypothetical protein